MIRTNRKTSFGNIDMENKKKKFSETKVGQLLGGLAGKVLPDSGILGVVKNLIDNDDELTPEQKEEAHRQMKELHALQVEDRKSARQREVEVSKTKKFDIMFNLTGFVSLAAFAYIVYAIVNFDIPESNKEVWIHLIGVSEGILLSIVGYFYGSSIKDNK